MPLSRSFLASKLKIRISDVVGYAMCCRCRNIRQFSVNCSYIRSKGKGLDSLLDIALLVNSSDSQSWKWQLIGMSHSCGLIEIEEKRCDPCVRIDGQVVCDSRTSCHFAQQWQQQQQRLSWHAHLYIKRPIYAFIAISKPIRRTVTHHQQSVPRWRCSGRPPAPPVLPLDPAGGRGFCPQRPPYFCPLCSLYF